jgi:pathogenesis-related protein 1
MPRTPIALTRIIPTGMRLVAIALVVLTSACVTLGGGKKKPDPATITANEIKAFVDFHNAARAEVKTPPVKWSKELAVFAQEWADHLAETGTIEHRPREGMFMQKYGENMTVGTTPLALIDAARGWYGEKKAYDAGKQRLPEDGPEIAHYTQMVWKASLEIGAGRAIIKTGQFKGGTIIVCNYDPRGNVVGQKPFD